MPIYEYRCQDCGHELEKLQRMNDTPLQDCPACEKPSLKRLVSAAGFRLKGSGWYETDFKTDGKKRNLADSGKDAEKKASGKDSSSSDKASEGSSSSSTSSDTTKKTTKGESTAA